MRRKSSDPKLNFWIGYLDGPPIGACETADRLKSNAILGSIKLLAALNHAGLRP